MVDADLPPQPLDSYISAVTLALGEMAATQVAVRNVSREMDGSPLGEVNAIVVLHAATEAMLILAFPQQTALMLAQRIFGDARVELSDGLIRDCVGEIANVIAGQAKTLLAGTPHQMTFALPQVVAAPVPDALCDQVRGRLKVTFESDAGGFLLGLIFKC
jgi:chemotaxis protein CheX